MMICEDCGAVFEDSAVIERRHINRVGEENEPPDYLCPNCHSGETASAEKCNICGEWHGYYEVYDGVCNECAEKLEEKIKDIVYRNFSVYEVDAIKAKYEGMEDVLKWD